MIRWWLRQEPSDDLADFAEQAARALNMEERHMTMLGNVIAGKLGELLGGGK